MPRGQSPFRGDYVVPESKVPEILMAGADAQAKQIEQGFAVAGQAIEQLGLNKKQQETDKATIKSALNMVDIVERNDPNKDDQKVSSYYEGMRTALNNENTPLHGRATFANNTLANFTLTSQLKSQQLNQASVALANELNTKLQESTVKGNELKNKNLKLTNQLAKTNLEVTEIENEHRIWLQQMMDNAKTGGAEVDWEEHISNRLEAMVRKPEVEVKAKEAQTAYTDALRRTQESQANLNNAKAAVVAAQGPQTLEKATENKIALQEAFPDENITFNIKQDDDGDWVTSANFKDDEYKKVGSPEWNQWLDDEIEHLGGLESVQATDYEGDDVLRPISNAKYLEFQQRYEQYQGMIDAGSSHKVAKKATGIDPDHGHTDVLGTIEWVYEEEGKKYRFYLRSMEALDNNLDNEHDQKLYRNLLKLRRNMQLRTESAGDDEIQAEIEGDEPSQGAKKLN